MIITYSKSFKLTSNRHACPKLHTRRINTSPRASIGFALGDEKSRPPPDSQCDSLYRSASSLLLLTPILKKQPAQSFLELLLLIQKGSPESIMQKYGEFYRHIVSLPTGDLTWSDFLLDQLLSTSSSDSPFAKAAAKGENISHLLPAVAHDLDIIQKLAVPEHLLAEWVKDSMKYGASISNDWLAAAASTTPLASSSSSSPPPPSSSSVVIKSSVIPNTSDSLPDAFLAPLTKEQRAALRADMAGRWRWSECAEELARYYATYGCGIVGGHRVLTWTGSSLQAQDVVQPSVHRLLGTEGKISPSGTASSSSTSASSSTQEASSSSSLGGGKTLLLKSLSQFAEVSPENRGYAVRPPHTLLIGTSIERWLAFSWASNSQAVIAHRTNTNINTSTNNTRQKLVPTLRTVLLPVNPIDTLPQLLWALHNQPRGRFIVYLASLEGTFSGGDGDGGNSSKIAEFVQMVSGLDGYSWPVNVMLVAGAEKEPCGDVVSVFEEMVLLDRK